MPEIPPEKFEPVPVEELEPSGSFADVWRLLARLPAEPMSEEFARRLTMAMQAELVRAEPKSAKPVRTQPVRVAARAVPTRLRVMLASQAVAAAAAIALGLGWYAVTLPTGSITSPSRIADANRAELSYSTPFREQDAADPDLSRVESLSREFLESLERLADLRQQSDVLEQEIARLADASTISLNVGPHGLHPENLDERFPFLNRTFEQTLDGL